MIFLQRYIKETPRLVEIKKEHLQNLALSDIENILNQNGRSLREFPSMPMPQDFGGQVFGNRLLQEELSYDCIEATSKFKEPETKLNDEQRKILTTVIEAYEGKKGGVFLVYDSGGTGKTFLWNTLIARFRSERKIVLSVASSGIAALCGRTTHSRFKIPLQLHDTST